MAGKTDEFIEMTLEELWRGEDVTVSCANEAQAQRIYDEIAERATPEQLARLHCPAATAAAYQRQGGVAVSTYSSGYGTCNCFADAVPGYDGHLPSCPMFGAVPPSASEASPAVSSGAFSSLEDDLWLSGIGRLIRETIGRVQTDGAYPAEADVRFIVEQIGTTVRALIADRARLSYVAEHAAVHLDQTGGATVCETLDEFRAAIDAARNTGTQSSGRQAPTGGENEPA